MEQRVLPTNLQGLEQQTVSTFYVRVPVARQQVQVIPSSVSYDAPSQTHFIPSPSLTAYPHLLSSASVQPSFSVYPLPSSSTILSQQYPTFDSHNQNDQHVIYQSEDQYVTQPSQRFSVEQRRYDRRDPPQRDYTFEHPTETEIALPSYAHDNLQGVQEPIVQIEKEVVAQSLIQSSFDDSFLPSLTVAVDVQPVYANDNDVVSEAAPPQREILPSQEFVKELYAAEPAVETVNFSENSYSLETTILKPSSAQEHDLKPHSESIDQHVEEPTKSEEIRKEEYTEQQRSEKTPVVDESQKGPEDTQQQSATPLYQPQSSEWRKKLGERTSRFFSYTSNALAASIIGAGVFSAYLFSSLPALAQGTAQFVSHHYESLEHRFFQQSPLQTERQTADRPFENANLPPLENEDSASFSEEFTSSFTEEASFEPYTALFTHDRFTFGQSDFLKGYQSTLEQKITDLGTTAAFDGIAATYYGLSEDSFVTSGGDRQVKAASTSKIALLYSTLYLSQDHGLFDLDDTLMFAEGEDLKPRRYEDTDQVTYREAFSEILSNAKVSNTNYFSNVLLYNLGLKKLEQEGRDHTDLSVEEVAYQGMDLVNDFLASAGHTNTIFGGLYRDHQYHENVTSTNDLVSIMAALAQGHELGEDQQALASTLLTQGIKAGATESDFGFVEYDAKTNMISAVMMNGAHTPIDIFGHTPNTFGAPTMQRHQEIKKDIQAYDPFDISH